jgi:hypothetical protein
LTKSPDESHNGTDQMDRLVRLGQQAVRDAQDESRRLGVPNVYSINGRLYYECADGELRPTTLDEYRQILRDQ